MLFVTFAPNAIFVSRDAGRKTDANWRPFLLLAAQTLILQLVVLPTIAKSPAAIATALTRIARTIDRRRRAGQPTAALRAALLIIALIIMNRRLRAGQRKAALIIALIIMNHQLKAGRHKAALSMNRRLKAGRPKAALALLRLPDIASPLLGRLSDIAFYPSLGYCCPMT